MKIIEFCHILNDFFSVIYFFSPYLKETEHTDPQFEIIDIAGYNGTKPDQPPIIKLTFGDF